MKLSEALKHDFATGGTKGAVELCFEIGKRFGTGLSEGCCDASGAAQQRNCPMCEPVREAACRVPIALCAYVLCGDQRKIGDGWSRYEKKVVRRFVGEMILNLKSMGD